MRRWLAGLSARPVLFDELFMAFSVARAVFSAAVPGAGDEGGGGDETPALTERRAYVDDGGERGRGGL